MPTLDEIRAASSPATFPVDVIRGARTAACFYCAAFGGRQDVIHVVDAGVQRITLVDTDTEKLFELVAAVVVAPNVRSVSPYAERADFMARSFVDLGDRFDVVTADPWTQDVPAALAALPTWCAIVAPGGHLIIGVTAGWFESASLPATAEGFRLWLAEQPVHASLVELRHRSDHLNGVWWAVLRVGVAGGGA